MKRICGTNYYKFKVALTAAITVGALLPVNAFAVNKFIVKDSTPAAADKFVVTDQGYIGVGTNNPQKPDADNVMAQIENMIRRKMDFKIDSIDGYLMETTFNNVGLLDFKKIDLIL